MPTSGANNTHNSSSSGASAARKKQIALQEQQIGQLLGGANKLLGYAPPGRGAPRGGSSSGRRSGDQEPPLLPGQASGKNKQKGGGKPGNPGDMYDLENEIGAQALRVMRGEEGRFGAEQVSNMKDQLFSATLGRVKTDIRAADAGAARRGMFRSGMANRTENDLRRNALTAYSTGVKDIMIKKAEAEFQDKMAGLNATQSWLQGKRQYEMDKERNAIARAQISASMAAAQLSAQVQREGIAASRGAASAQMRFNEQGRALSLAQYNQQMSFNMGPGGQSLDNYSNYA